jgi:hypothetical protein
MLLLFNIWFLDVVVIEDIYASEATSVLVLYTYRHDVFFWMQCFQISELLPSYISICLIVDVFPQKDSWVLVLIGPIVFLSLCIVGLIRLVVV